MASWLSTHSYGTRTRCLLRETGKTSLGGALGRQPNLRDGATGFRACPLGFLRLLELEKDGYQRAMLWALARKPFLKTDGGYLPRGEVHDRAHLRRHERPF